MSLAATLTTIIISAPIGEFIVPTRRMGWRGYFSGDNVRASNLSSAARPHQCSRKRTARPREVERLIS